VIAPAKLDQAEDGEANCLHREAISNVLRQSPILLDYSNEARKGIEHRQQRRS
jgi:hypothetical protein